MTENIKTDARVSNKPVSIHLDDGESTTVPYGEVWLVTCTLSDATSNTVPDDGTDQTLVTIDGSGFMYSSNSGIINKTKTVLTAGRTLSVNSDGNGSLHIGGFVVGE